MHTYTRIRPDRHTARQTYSESDTRAYPLSPHTLIHSLTHAITDAVRALHEIHKERLAAFTRLNQLQRTLDPEMLERFFMHAAQMRASDKDLAQMIGGLYSLTYTHTHTHISHTPPPPARALSLSYMHAHLRTHTHAHTHTRTHTHTQRERERETHTPYLR